MKKELQRFMSQCRCLDMTVLIDVKLEDPLIKDKKVSLLGGMICGQKISMGSVNKGSSCGGGSTN
ncbi:hypothetical protein PPACK8108_LOCUS21894 [Phakopsora pachyrhizi]|uniref:Uncharacterized protein n=1 Tax=Phakopsora pachyrhizi TaxID=170000 RepID=A0AAV0BLG5_PHAPC|nr:hypothetical protein PPACK8108_LOCUS21894 [Phakopsora pachyrhizi]